MGQKWFKPQLPKYSLNTNIHRMRGNGSFLSASTMKQEKINSPFALYLLLTTALFYSYLSEQT